MSGYLHLRTAYSLVNVPIPQFFIDLENYFETLFPPKGKYFNHPNFILLENLCRRMADIELYSSMIRKQQQEPDFRKATVLIGTFLVGYFTSCKALFDAVSISIATVYDLNLTDKEKDFGKGQFWRQLNLKSTNAYKQYRPFKELFDIVIKWRDAAIHRLTPFVIVISQGNPDKLPRDKIEIKVVNRPDVTLDMFNETPQKIQFVEPLYYHKEWLPQFTNLCKNTCLDIYHRTK